MKKMLFLTLAVLLLPLVAFADDLLWQKDVVSQIVGAKFTHDGKSVIVVAQDRIIKYDAATGENAVNFAKVADITNQISCVEMHPTENILITGGREKRLLFWNIETGDTISSLKTEWNTTDLAIFPDGTKIITTHAVAESEDAVVWDINTKAVLAKLKLGGEGWFVKISKDGKYCITAAMYYNAGTKQTNGIFKLWDAQTYQEIAILGTHDGEINDIDISPDSKYAAFSGAEDYVKVFDIEIRKLYKTFVHIQNPDERWGQASIKFSNDSKYIISGHREASDWNTKIWNVEGGELYKLYPIVLENIDIEKESKYVCGNIGQRFYILGNPWTSVETKKEENQILYPNPANGIINIEVKTTIPEYTEINIYNESGKQIVKLFSGILEPGNKTFQWNTMPFPAGMYFCRIESKSRNLSYKIIVNK